MKTPIFYKVFCDKREMRESNPRPTVWSRQLCHLTNLPLTIIIIFDNIRLYNNRLRGDQKCRIRKDFGDAETAETLWSLSKKSALIIWRNVLGVDAKRKSLVL